jgi:acyl-CoA reductase-like NAD-dependent aldehyde dehydrogenase
MRRHMQVMNPATGELLRELDPAAPAEVAAAAGRARAAQPVWAATPLAHRRDVVRRFRALAVERAEDLARTLTLEVGKPIRQARSELAGLLPRIDFFLEEVERALADRVVLADAAERLEERVRQEPLGVVANVSAWNYPWYVGANVFLPALLTGNAVLYKPSEYATLTGLAIGGLLHEAGVPEDVFQVLVGDGAVGAALVAQPVDAVCFTGSHATGVRVATAVAARLVRLQLELGGKDPAYVCDDADAAATAAAVADGAFYNTGQSCCAVERVYVHERLYAPFLAAFVEAVRGFTVGDPLDAETYIGPLARREAALALLDAQVADAVGAGARLLLGGARLPRPGFYFAPTVLADAGDGTRVMREESFGPIIGIAPVASDAEAVARMNATEFGLTAAVYTADRTRAEALLARLDTGTAYWNCCDRVSPRLPWTGRGASGLGVTLAREGVAAFLRPKAYHLRAPAQPGVHGISPAPGLG